MAPAWSVKQRPGNVTGVQDLGPDATQPGAVHHYRFRADAYQLLASAMLFTQQVLTVLHDDDSQITADLDTDSAGHPMRYATKPVMFNDRSGTVYTLGLTENYSDFGTPVDVAAPDPAEVADGLPAGAAVVGPPNPDQ